MSAGLRDQRVEVPGFPHYFVNALGEVFSRNPSGHHRAKIKRDGFMPMRPYWDGRYETVCLYVLGERRTVTVHHLVAIAFHGEPPFLGAQVRHLDGNGRNNGAINLRWGSATENEADKKRHGVAAVGSRHGAAKLTEADVIAIRAHGPFVRGDMTNLAHQYGVSRRAIWQVVTGVKWKHVEGACL